MSMKRTYKNGLVLVTLLSISMSCGDDFLNQTPQATLKSEYIIGSAQGVEGLLVGTYALLDGFVNGVATDPYKVASSNWTFGSIGGGEAAKGSDSGDQPEINEIQTYSITAGNYYNERKFRSLYDGVFMANLTIQKLAELSDAQVPAVQRKRIIAEARALRGFYHFEAKKLWDDVPYVDENTDLTTVANGEGADVWAAIEADFKAASDDLEDVVVDKGRWNHWAAKAYLGKVQIFRKKWDDANTTLQDVYDNGKTQAGVKYGLNPTFRRAFDGNNDNSLESVMAVQYTSNDGSGGINASAGEVLNFPHNGDFGAPTNCCGFYQPSHDLANSFRTVSGLPLLDGSYNDDDQEVLSDEYVEGGIVKILESPATDADRTTAIYVDDGGELDPRIDWTIGRRGVPYLDWGVHPGKKWIRDASNGGPYSPKKHVFNKADVGTYTDGSSWTAGFATNNYYLMRFSDLILLLAEAKIEKAAPDLAGAMTLINQVRTRAAASNVPGSPADYNIANYTAFADQVEARAALHMERKLELGMEGHRFFDLVRWGEASQQLNKYVNYEKKYRVYLRDAAFTPNEDEYLPIPQRQIELSGGKIVQNNFH